MEVYVTLEELTEEERKSTPKLVGIDLNWYLKAWVSSRKNRDIEFIDYIQEDIELLVERAKDEIRSKDN
jgi:uncharacterized protein YjaG (DUF416 family)